MGSAARDPKEMIRGRTATRLRFLLTAIVILPVASVLPASAGGDETHKAPESGTILGAAPGHCRFLSDSGLAYFPFEIFRGDIRFEGEINGRPIHLLLDDGFMWDPLLFWGSPKVDSLGLEYDGGIALGNSEDSDAITSRTASGITVRFPGVEFTEQTAVITPYSSGNSEMWTGSVGQVSCTFLKHCVVDINFDDMMITLIKPSDFEYHGGGVAIPWRPMGFGPWAIPATLHFDGGETVSLDLMMDLGYNDQLQISTAGEHNIAVPAGAAPTSLGFNIQGVETRGFRGRVARVDIGGYELKDVTAGFVSKEHSDHTFHEVMVGLGLLSRFNLVFDYSRQRLFVEPNRGFHGPFE